MGRPCVRRNFAPNGNSASGGRPFHFHQADACHKYVLLLRSRLMDMRLPPELAPKRPRGRPRKTADELEDGNRRRELLTSAAKLFRRKGFDASSTRDIAAAAGMQSGSPFYHFKSKGALLYAVMEEGMRSAIERQQRAILAAGAKSAAARLRVLIRNHFDVLLGPGSDFVPVMLYEARAITTRQRAALAELQSAYEAPWVP